MSGVHRKGATRPYPEAVDLGVIDVRVRDLVETLNVPGVVSTFASCEGHSWLGRSTGPYVSFEAEVGLAFALSLKLDADAMGDSPRLKHAWSIRGHFSSDRGLTFRLAIPSMDYRRQWCRGAHLDADFAVLRSISQEIFGASKNKNPK